MAATGFLAATVAPSADAAPKAASFAAFVAARVAAAFLAVAAFAAAVGALRTAGFFGAAFTALFFGTTFLGAAFLARGAAGPLARLSLSNSTARSKSISSIVSAFGIVALVTPSVT